MQYAEAEPTIPNYSHYIKMWTNEAQGAEKPPHEDENI